MKRRHVAHIGEDELLVVLFEVGDFDQVTRIAEKVRDVVTSPVTLAGVATRIKLRAGVSIEQPGDTVEQLLIRAFQAGKKAPMAPLPG